MIDRTYSHRIYKTKAKRLSGTRHADVLKKAKVIYKRIRRNTKRKSYIRSVYFYKEKIFVDLFWRHLYEKNLRDKTRRLRFFKSAIELILHSHLDPDSKKNPNKSSEILHRFEGITADKYRFAVQIKEDKKTSQKYFYSVFPRS